MSGFEGEMRLSTTGTCPNQSPSDAKTNPGHTVKKRMSPGWSWEVIVL